MATRRLDVALFDRGLVRSREQGHAAVLAGRVRVDGTVVTKAGAPIGPDSVLEVEGGARFVSRGGTKLDHALDVFGVDVSGCAVLDVGASTGGFTDCVLQRGAASVTSIDVGYGQLAWELRTDSRVLVLERTNIRTVDPATLGGPFDLAVVDVSFISLGKVLPHILPVIADDGAVIALIKPQFEAGKGRVGKKGVVREPALHVEVLENAVSAIEGAGWVVRGLTWSPITGPEGNIEFLVWLARTGESATADPRAVVEAAHAALGG